MQLGFLTMKTFHILGLLLAYPTIEHKQALPECLRLLQEEQALSTDALTALDQLIMWMGSQDLLDLQESYVDLFDRTPSLSLHLFEHVHGDSSARGQALVDLANVYKDAKLVTVEDELPDYLPLFLEYLSLIDPVQARHDLAGVINILGTLAERLRHRKSPYAHILTTLIAIADVTPDRTVIDNAISKDTGAPLSGQQIDTIWEEQAAFENTTTDANRQCAPQETKPVTMHYQPRAQQG
jgi:nitrate reductase delta subunit